MNRNRAGLRAAIFAARLASAILCCSYGAAFVVAAPVPVPSLVLTNVQQVRGMATNAPGRSLARFEAVVIYVSPPTQRLYVQDGDLGLQVNVAGPVTRFRLGQVVRVEGDAVPGLPFPRVVSATAAVVGEASLPEPPRSSAARLASGQDAFRFVTLRGVVRDMISDRGALTLVLSDEWRAFELALPLSNVPLPRDLIDAEIEVRGLAYPFYNFRNLPTGFRFHATSLDFVRVITPGTRALFDRPALTIADATRQPWEWQRRLKVTGTVTAHQPVETLFIDDGTGPMQANLLFPLARPENGEALEHDTPAWLQPGDRVEVIGVRHNWSSLTPTLILAEVRRIGKAPPVSPRPVSIADLQAGRFSGRVVSVTARLLDQRLWNTGNLQHEILMLEAGGQVFQATWASELPAVWDLQPGSYVRVTGVNDAGKGRFNRACLFQILLRSPVDVVPVAAPPFWMRRDFQRLGAAGGGVALLAGAWIFLQRGHLRRLERRVTERTADLRNANENLREEITARERAETEVQRALAQEKQLNELKSRFVSMVSHEFRTPLAIIMSSAEILDAYLERLSGEDRAANLRDIAEAARQMGAMMEEVLLLSRVEAGKMTYQPLALDIVSLCERIVDEIDSAANRRCPIQLTVPVNLPPARGDEALLRHIFTNLLANAVKYSAPGAGVTFEVETQGDLAVFTVRDQGIGIPDADIKQLFQAFHRGSNVGNVPGSGLGLVIVKSCVELHHGSITFHTREGQGSTFVVSLPLLHPSPGAFPVASRPRPATVVNPILKA